MKEPFSPEEEPYAQAFADAQAPPSVGDYRQRAATGAVPPGSRFRALLAAAVVAIVGVLSAGYFGLHLAGQPASGTALPAARSGGALAYDEALGGVILFGGSGADGALNDTWKFDGSQWTELHPAQSPPAMSYAQLAYDPASHLLVLNGTAIEKISGAVSGSGACRSTATGPPVCTSNSSNCIGFAGTGTVTSGGSVAVLQGQGTGTFTVTMSPYPGGDASPPAGGGIVCSGTPVQNLNQTWTFDGSNWQKITSSFGSGETVSMATDWTHGQLVAVVRGLTVPILAAPTAARSSSSAAVARMCPISPRVNGSNNSASYGCGFNYPQMKTYVFENGKFVDANASVAPQSYSAYIVVYDDGANALELIPDSGLMCAMKGGAEPATMPPCTVAAEVWNWSGTGWSRLSHPQYPTDLFGSQVASAPGGVMFVGSNGNAVLWTAGQDSKPVTLLPGARSGEALAFDRANSALVLFGGESGNLLRESTVFVSGGGSMGNDTWTFADGSWTKVSGQTPPSPSPLPEPTVCPDIAGNHADSVPGCPICGSSSSPLPAPVPSEGAAGISGSVTSNSAGSLQVTTSGSGAGLVTNICFGGGPVTISPAPTPSESPQASPDATATASP